METSTRYLNVRETARLLDVHENTVRNWVSNGTLISARLPGTRAHRFDETVVERLRQERGAAVSAAARPHRRTFGPELVDATQLSEWASTREAQGTFPELIRRLMAATPAITNASVRSGEGVALHGWDGLASSTGTTFLPAGELHMEFGVSRSPKSKADDDWVNRVGDPPDDSLAAAVFVFITPRRWKHKTEWERDHRDKQVFADVRVLDADDLEGWLQAAPAVHYWLSERLGRNPRGAESMERWWSRFQGRTRPALPLDLFMAGRSGDAEELTRRLRGDADVTTVKAAWREDALAFVWAVIDGAGASQPIPPPILVSDAATFLRLVEHESPMTLLPLFDDAAVGAAADAGHHVVLIGGGDQLTIGNVIALPRPHRHEAGSALDRAGVGSDRSYQLGALARRSMPALVRELARDPRFTRPDWARPPDSVVVAPLALLGSWTGADADLAIVADFAGRTWAEAERTLTYWRSTDDPPFIKSGEQWHLASPEQAFLALRDVLTSEDLRRWREAALVILTEPDPTAEFPADERQLAALRGVKRRHSSVLRRGVAGAAALLGAAGELRLAGGETGPEHARDVVRAITDAANADATGRLWCSLADVLPLLAEAAPDTFLDAVHDDLDRADPTLRVMFGESDGGSWMQSGSAHTGLLWALETLCWSPDHLLESCRALARLDAIDPGGRLLNRPAASLRSVLVGWVRHTSAPTHVRMLALASIGDHQPDLAWQLILALLPERGAVSSPPSSPRYRDWTPENQNVTLNDWLQFVEGLIDLALRLAAGAPQRWAELAGHLAELPPQSATRVLEFIEAAVASEPLDDDQRLRVWEAVTKVVAKHERFAEAEWAMTPEMRARLQQIADDLEPTDRVVRFAYLFDWRPDLPGVPQDDHRRYRERLAEVRADAVRQVLADDDLGRLRELAQRAPVPGQFGHTLAEQSPAALDGELLRWLSDDEPAVRQAANAWVAGKLRQDDGSWLRAALDAVDGDARLQVAVAAPATPGTWAIVEADPSLGTAYWANMEHLAVDQDGLEHAVGKLIEHDRGWDVVDLLSMQLHDAGGAATLNLVRSGLRAALSASGDRLPQSPGYEVGLLLQFLEDGGAEPEELATFEFQFFRVLEGGSRRPTALYGLMTADPSLFVTLVSQVYRGASEPRRSQSENEATQTRHAWLVLHHFDALPGRNEDGSVDAEHLTRWVRQARLTFSENDRQDVGDEEIGRLLAYSPPDPDDHAWPTQAVRDLIESIGSTHLETGVHVGCINSRGVTSRGIYDGGQRERSEARRYREWAAACAGRWPRTARMLRRLAESYERDARDEDARAEITSDTR